MLHVTAKADAMPTQFPNTEEKRFMRIPSLAIFTRLDSICQVRVAKNGPVPSMKIIYNFIVRLQGLI